MVDIPDIHDNFGLDLKNKLTMKGRSLVDQEAIQQEKERLRDTQMHKLGFGHAFNRYFCLTYSKKCKERKYGSSITLATFFKLNVGRVNRRGYNKSPFVCREDNKGPYLYANASIFRQFLGFLKKKGFNGDDWSFLSTAPPPQLNMFPFATLSGKALYGVAITSWMKRMSKKAEVFQTLKEVVKPEDGIITTHQLLSVTKEAIEAVIGTVGTWKKGYDHIQGFRWFIIRLQERLKEKGLNEKDGPFMTVSLKREIKGRPKRLKHPRALCDAKNLPIPGKEEYYYPLEYWKRRFGDPIKYFGEERWYGSRIWAEMQQGLNEVQKTA